MESMTSKRLRVAAFLAVATAILFFGWVARAQVAGVPPVGVNPDGGVALDGGSDGPTALADAGTSVTRSDEPAAGDGGAGQGTGAGLDAGISEAAAPVPHVKLTPTPLQQKETAEFIDMPESTQAAAPTAPKDERRTPGYIAGYRQLPSLSLSPYAPQMYWPSLGVTPSFGSRAPEPGFRFDFHGYMSMPLRVGVGSRPNAGPGQNSITLHGDPVLPGSSFGWFEQTPTAPWPYAMGTFVMTNDVVTATLSLGAWNIGESMTASTYFQNPAQQWFAQAFLDYQPKIDSPITFKIRAGAYPERYGYMAQYDLGAYPSPFIAYIRGIGTTATVVFPFEYDLDLKLEAGFKGDINHPPTDLTPSPSNNYASAAQGSTFAGHAHAALTYKQVATFTLHYVGAFEQDDRRDGFDDPSTTQTNEATDAADGRLQTLGADLTVNGGRFGYLYLGTVKTDFHNVEHMNDLVQVLNTGSGKLLMQRYLGQEGHGNGSLTMVGGQYTLSLGTLLRYPSEFYGEGPDLLVSVFGVFANTTSDDPTYDGKQMFKYGTEVTYSFLPWLAVAGRIDHVVPDTRDMGQSFAVFAPKLVFRNDWLGSWRGGTLTLEYAAYALGNHVIVNGDTRLMNNPSGRPDSQMFAIFATLSW